MCGIAGFVDFTGTLTKLNLIGMTDALQHRGPDDSGYTYHKNNFVTVALGHRRLSILDLSLNGHQPMRYDSIELIYNVPTLLNGRRNFLWSYLHFLLVCHEVDTNGVQ